MKEQGYEQLTLFPEGFPASLSRRPGSTEALEMTVTSGLRCSGLSGNSGPLGCLVRMCLESSIWHSTRCYLTWKTKDTKRRRLLFQLQVQMPRTDGNECVFWPTPMASSWGGTGHRAILKRMQEKGLITEEERMSLQSGNWGRTDPKLIEWLMGYTREFTRLIPTPTATDYKGGCPKRYPGGGKYDNLLRSLLESTPRGNVGPMNPAFLEWLMGFPIGWTELGPSETQ